MIAQAAGLLLLLGLAPCGAAERPVRLSALSGLADAYQDGDAAHKALFRQALRNGAAQALWEPDGTVYVKTGDIPAEWLRDSSVQVRPYLYYVKQDPQIAAFLRGVIARQFKYLHSDPYANAFKADGTVWEEKFELDSLCYPIMLAWTYWRETSDSSIFTPALAQGLQSALRTMEAEQDHASSPRRYSHKELTNNPVARTGMIWSGFRPSDDACAFNFLIPSEMMAVAALGELAQIETEVYHDGKSAERALKLRREVHEGIQRYGVVPSAKYGPVYAYEVDGLGHSTLMDDANLPSLLSTPYLGYGSAQDPVYRNTRRLVLSSDDPFFYSGSLMHGVGSPHTPAGYVWPLALLAQGLTAATPSEARLVLAELEASDPGDGRLHESGDPSDPAQFTREDFGWPNSLLAEFLLRRQGRKLPAADTGDLRFGGAFAQEDDMSGFEARVFVDGKGGQLPYRMLKPQPFDPKAKYPLVLFLHGAGERGSDNQAQLKNAVSAFARKAAREKFPCFVVVPQCPAGKRWVEMDWDADSGVQPARPSVPMNLSMAALAALQKEFKIDSKRLYVAGISMGGFGVWDALTRYPRRFAAGVAVCGGGDESKAARLKDTPIWAFHSEDDPVVNVSRSRNMVQALREAGGSPRYTEYQGLGHISWDRAFSEPQLLPWLFEQARP